MNKISKKIVALATMAAFVLTLVPAAAFAAADETSNPASAAASEYTVMVDGQKADTVAVDANDEVTTKFIVKDQGGKTTSEALAVRVWATDKEGNITDALQIETAGLNTSSIKNTFYGSVKNGQEFTISFTRDGEYTLHATEQGSAATAAELDNLVKLQGADVVTVNADAVVADRLAFYGKTGVALEKEGNNDTVVQLDLTNAAQLGSFEFNGTDSYTIEGYAYQEDGSRATNTTFNLSTSRSDVVVLANETATTDDNGFFKFSFKMTDSVDSNIYVENDDVSYTIHVVAGTSAAEKIDTTLEDGYVLAGTDSNWSEDYATFGDAVQFEITDKKGNVLSDKNVLTGEPAAYRYDNNGAGKDHANFFSIDTKPTKSDLDVNDLVLAWDGSNYTLKYVGNDEEHDLIPGEYTVTLSLLSGDNATATFNVAKFGTIQDLDVAMYAKTTGAAQDQYKKITDEIALGEDLKVEAKYVDENGIKIPAKNAEYGVDGKAVVGNWASLGFNNQYKIAENTVANESLIGTTIYVKAYDSKAKKYVEKELTVVDAYNTYTLAFDPTEGDANKDNTVTVSVVDADGDLANKVSGEVYAYVADQSNADAKVTVSTKNAVDGKGKLTIFSDKETTVDIVVAVRNGDALYGKTLEYTVGEEDALANTSVVMTIGSPDFVVNNQVITMEDAAPYVAKDRTFVPFRALGEAIGADVVWDNDARTVTYTLGKTEVVMTIGETTYTVNGEEKTMDVAPEITGERTYVPVRFVGEALGFKVTALYAADGTTASVVFQK